MARGKWRPALVETGTGALTRPIGAAAQTG